MTECKACALQLLKKRVCEKNRRKNALETRQKLIGQVPKEWLDLPFTDSHAREEEKNTSFEEFIVTKVISPLIESTEDALLVQKTNVEVA